jgi:SAM-dependent methyltransferase
MAWFLKRVAKAGLRKLANGMGLQEILSKEHQLATELRRLREICSRIEHQMPVAPGSLPIPPRQLHFLVSGNDDLDISAFFEIGRACADTVVGLLKKQGVDTDDLGAILDFGCGCGRVIRYFNTLKRAKMHGTDYNPELIDWCKKNLPFAEFKVNGPSPPLVYADGSFGLIYTFSVFTHLSEELQVSWLAELSRVLKPGGYLLLTTHGAADAELYLPAREREKFQSGQLVVVNDGSSCTNVCAAFHPATYVQQNLIKGFDLLEFVPGELVDSGQRTAAQDVYLLKKS